MAYRCWLDASRAKLRSRVAGKVRAVYGDRIVQGPFAGMVYPGFSHGSEATPKLLGCYESELHGLIELVCSKRYGTIIDVGCAEGYYAIGLARRCPWARVLAYDIAGDARRLCRDLSAVNGVNERVQVHEAFTPDMLEGRKCGPTLVVCDCEGAEYDLFHPTMARHWVGVDAIVELHELSRPGVTGRVLDTLASSHDIELINSRTPDATRLASLWFLSNQSARDAAVDELRYPMQWVWARARNNNA